MIEINLLPGSSKRAARQPRRKSSSASASAKPKVKLPSGGSQGYGLFTAASTVLSVLLVGWLWWSAGARESELNTAIEGAVRDSARYAALRAANAELIARQDTIAQKVQVIQEIDAGRYVWSHVMEEVSRAIPPYIWLTAVEADMNSPDPLHPTMKILGSAGNTLALTRFIQDLEASPFLRTVTLQTTTQIERENRKYYTFELRASAEDPPAEAIRTAPLFAQSDSLIGGD